MRRIVINGFIAAVLISICAVAFADGPAQPAANMLFGAIIAPGGTVSGDPAAVYEKSGVTAAFIDVNWGKCEASDPGNAPSKYDFSSFDSSPFFKSSKTRIAMISLDNSWASKLDKERYWKLADSFLSAFIKHANETGVSYFFYTIEQENPFSSVGPTSSSIEPLKHLYKTAKTASKNNVVIAFCPYGSGANAADIAYGAGAKGAFDILGVNVMPLANRPGIDAYSIMEVHREMMRNGDGDKRTLVGVLPETVWNPSSIALFVEETFRGLWTERDVYDPNWVAGVFTRVGVGNLMMAADLLKVEIPKTAMNASLSADSPIFNYVAGRTYKLALKITNSTDREMKLGTFSVALRGAKDCGIDAKPDGNAPTTVPAGGEATANFSLVLPNNAAGKQVTLVGCADYTLDGAKHIVDAWLTVLVSPQLEITLLPSRSVMNPTAQEQKVGMSVINHADSAFERKISLTSTPGIKVAPSEFDTRIDAEGLEAYMFSVAADKNAAPGHYAVYVNVDGQAQEWAAVDVPVMATKFASAPKMDGNLNEWSNVSAVSIAKATQGSDGKYSYEIIGKGYFAYDASNLYVAVETDNAKYADSTVSLGFDPQMNGAKSAAGGFKDDDCEVILSGSSDKPSVSVINKPADTIKGAKVAMKKSGEKSVREIAIPWSSLAPFTLGKDKTLAAAILVDGGDGNMVEWGGGLAGEKDPRKFIPVMLSDSL